VSLRQCCCSEIERRAVACVWISGEFSGHAPSRSSISWEYGIKVPAWDKRVPDKTPGHVRGSESRNESHKPSGQRQQYGKLNSPSSAIGIARGGKAPSRILPVEGDQLRAVGPQPRNESAGGAITSPGGDPPRRRGQIRGSGDVGGKATPSYQPETVAAESGKYLHHPDEGRSEFTMVPEVESLTRGSAMSSQPRLDVSLLIMMPATQQCQLRCRLSNTVCGDADYSK